MFSAKGARYEPIFAYRPMAGPVPGTDGKLISLQEGGFQHFMGLTVPNVKKVVDDVAAQRTGVN